MKPSNGVKQIFAELKTGRLFIMRCILFQIDSASQSRFLIDFFSYKNSALDKKPSTKEHIWWEEGLVNVLRDFNFLQIFQQISLIPEIWGTDIRLSLLSNDQKSKLITDFVADWLHLRQVSQNQTSGVIWKAVWTSFFQLSHVILRHFYARGKGTIWLCSKGFFREQPKTNKIIYVLF